MADQTTRSNPSNGRNRSRSNVFELFEGDSDIDDYFEIPHVSDDSGSSSSSEEETPDDDPRSRSRPAVPDELGPTPDQFGWQEIDLEPNRQRIDPNFTV